MRKGYHLLAAALFLPALAAQPALLGRALAGAFAALAAAEAARVGGLPALAPRLHAFMAPFVDARDGGAFFVTHLALLLGMAAPVWLSNALDDAAPAWAAAELWPAAAAGVLALGLGDAAASAVGRAAGRTPVARGAPKTVEGAVAGTAATLAGWAALAAVTGAGARRGSWGGGAPGGAAAAGAAATAAACLLEAATAQLDNIFLPLHYFALLLLV